VWENLIISRKTVMRENRVIMILRNKTETMNLEKAVETRMNRITTDKSKH